MTYRQWSLIVFLGALWGASFLFMRISVPEVGPLFTGAMRVVFAGVFLGMVALAVGQAGHWENKKKMAFFSLINSAIPFSLFSFAANYLPAGYLSVLNATAPMLGLLIGIFFFDIHPCLKAQDSYLVLGRSLPRCWQRAMSDPGSVERFLIA